LTIVSFPETNELEAKLYYQSTEGSLCLIANKQVTPTVGEIISSSTLSPRIDIRSLLTYFPQTATIDYGSIPNGAQVTTAVNSSGDMNLLLDGCVRLCYGSVKDRSGGMQTEQIRGMVNNRFYPLYIYIFFFYHRGVRKNKGMREIQRGVW